VGARLVVVACSVVPRGKEEAKVPSPWPWLALNQAQDSHSRQARFSNSLE
jgi:hypothetical protein